MQTKVLNKAEAVEFVYQAPIVEGLTEAATKPYVCLQNDLLLLFAQCLEFITEDVVDEPTV